MSEYILKLCRDKSLFSSANAVADKPNANIIDKNKQNIFLNLLLIKIYLLEIIN